MRWATILHGGVERVGLLVDGDVYVARGVDRLVDLLGDDGEGLARAGDETRRDPALVVPLAGAELLAPIPQPPTVRDFYAFEQHVETARRRRGLEMDPLWYQLPVFYFSNPYAVIGNGAAVAAPPGCLELDYELEIAAVIGRGGHDLTPAAAEASIAGYCVMNDWSARDLQREEMKLGMGPVKGKDFATTLGPVLVTPDELAARRAGKAFDVTMSARVNGVEYSRASLADIFWSFGEMIAYASRGTRVAPGDIIGSGTCGTGCILELGLVHGHDRYPWLVPGDTVELEVDGLGVITNRVAHPG